MKNTVMKTLSRREFIQLASAGLGALALNPLLAACSKDSETIPPQAVRTNPPATSPQPTGAAPTLTAEAASTEIREPAPAAPTRQSAGAAQLVVARGPDPEELVRQALAALGGIEKFVPRGARVVIKPNICVAYHTYEYAATTNPWVVGALVRLALEAGARSVQVMDYPFGGSASEAYERSGIKEQVQAAGGEMAAMPAFKYIQVDLPLGQDLKQTWAFKDALQADVLIDVPIAKHHGQARLTLGMKNLMGLVQDRSEIHHNLGQRVADLASLFQPDLTVIDAVRILMDNGPTGGDLDDVKKLDTIIASADIVAADSYATSLFGLRPEDIAYIPAAAAIGLGSSDLAGMKIEEIAVGG